MTSKVLVALVLAASGALGGCSQEIRVHGTRGGAAVTSSRALAHQAVTGSETERADAIRQLRAAGPAGLDALFDAFPEQIARAGEPGAERLRSAVERVARQRDAHTSRLYWYTDLEKAKAQARATGRPILSLRLLGNLDEELSCANSRFFRTALYANADVGRLLREHFVLHWKSERPAPKITIDFGDGRKMERTITGNSIHYVLDADGRPIDGIPGLYGPTAFSRALHSARAAAAVIAQGEPSERGERVRVYHAARRGALEADWAREVGGAPLPTPIGASAAPRANAAAPIAMSKAKVEAPMVQAVGMPVTALPSPTNREAWARLLAKAVDESRLDASSRALMRRKIAEGAEPTPKGHDAESFERRVAAFEAAIAEDTVRNEYTLHRAIHEWMAMSPPPDDLEALNQRVYASLFLTPRSDPWLGLLQDDGYAAIPAEGVRVARP
jgi:hypothetical protein